MALVRAAPARSSERISKRMGLSCYQAGWGRPDTQHNKKYDSIASVGFVVALDLEADETVGISTNDFAVCAIHDYGLVRVDRRLGVALLLGVLLRGAGLRDRRDCHESGKGDGG